MSKPSRDDQAIQIPEPRPNATYLPQCDCRSLLNHMSPTSNSWLIRVSTASQRLIRLLRVDTHWSALVYTINCHQIASIINYWHQLPSHIINYHHISSITIKHIGVCRSLQPAEKPSSTPVSRACWRWRSCSTPCLASHWACAWTAPAHAATGGLLHQSHGRFMRVSI